MKNLLIENETIPSNLLFESGHGLNAESLLQNKVIPLDWKNQLAELLTGNDLTDPTTLDSLPNLKQLLHGRSTYTHKQAALTSLKIIYLRLTKQLDAEFNPLNISEASSIKNKLLEQENSCMPGIHNRVNEIVSGFFIPNTIADLLYSVRFHLVAQVASAYENVHLYSGVFYAARATGYGVKPPHLDVYRSIPIDATSRLQDVFKDLKYPEHFFNHLFIQLQSTLLTYFEYEGKKDVEEPYCGEKKDRIDHYLKNLFKISDETYDPKEFWETEPLNVLGDISQVATVINWAQAKERLLASLIDKKYILTQTLEDKPGPRQWQASLNFFNKHFSAHIKNLAAQIPEDIIYRILGCKKDDRKKALLKAARYHPMLVAPLLSTIKHTAQETLAAILSATDTLGRNALTLAAFEQPTAVGPIINTIKKLPAKHQEAIFSRGLIYLKKALLSTALHKPHALIPLLNGIKELPKKSLAAILSAKDAYGRNVLILTAFKQYAAVASILNEIKKLPTDIQVKILSTTTTKGVNTLMIAASYPSTAVTLLLSMIEKFPKNIQAKMLSAKDTFDRNTLILAAIFQPNAIEPLLNLINNLPKENQIAILSTKNIFGRNALMVTADHQPSAIERFLPTLDFYDLRSLIVTRKSASSQSDQIKSQLNIGLLKAYIKYRERKKADYLYHGFFKYLPFNNSFSRNEKLDAANNVLNSLTTLSPDQINTSSLFSNACCQQGKLGEIVRLIRAI